MTVYHSNIKLLLMLTLLIHCYIKINCRYCKNDQQWWHSLYTL